MDNVTERFVSVLRPVRDTSTHRAGCGCRSCAPRPPIDNAEFGEMLMRMIRTWEARVIDDPEMLAQNVMIAQRMNEITNVAIAANAERYAVDPRRGASMAECARILGISKPSASERRARGVVVMAERIDRAGAVRFAEAQREREALAAAHGHAVTHLSDYVARRAS
jgi:hypothetical protein